MKTTLTIEESARLIELGVDAKLASTRCLDFNGTFAYISGEEADWVKDRINEHYYTENPIVFSLSDLLSILPKEIEGNVLDLLATGYNKETESLEKGWSATYIDKQCIPSFGKDAIFSAPELIDSLYQLAIWCLETGHLKTEKK